MEDATYNGPVVSRAAARVAGLKWYFTGVACKRGHVDRRLVSNASCRSCANLRVRTRRQTPEYQDYLLQERTKSLARARSKRYKDADPKRTSDQGRVYRQSEAGRAAIRAKDQRYRVTKTARLKAVESTTRYRLTERGRLMHCLAEQARRARKRRGQGSFSADDLAKLLARQKKCHICARRFTKAAPPTIDHVIPLIRGGDHAAHNIALAHKSCNSRKQAQRTHLL
jgi:hypothetical protein